ncbi:hypothetical protein LTR66_011249 [Elasticomyces elasticus]|nr:hypothetical protein LTR28_005255 [Elasticomyces elasticus]KAK4973189.1 hypothetical protein LTR66_011249 [Elasticomyces elasticus]
MIGVLMAQLYRLQHSLVPSTTFGYFVISKPLAAIFEIAAIVLVLLGAYRSWRQQNAMARGKVWVGGWEIWWIMSGTFLLLVFMFAIHIALDIARE